MKKPLPPAQTAAAAIDALAGALKADGEAGRRVLVVGAAREVGTTLTAIALARSLARHSRVVLVDLAFASPNIDVISSIPDAPGIADLVRGAASFGDIITRDRYSRLHLVATGTLDGDAARLMESHMLQSAIEALAQSYNHLVIDAGAQTGLSLESASRMATRAVLVAGATPEANAEILRGQFSAAGFADVTVLTGPPPTLEHAATETAAA